MAEQLIVSTDWLDKHLSDPMLRVVDIRGHVLPASQPPPHYFNHEADYQKEHIPGAVFVDWVHEITDPNDPRHALIARPDRFSAAMNRIGITPETQVVTYDDAKGMFAARLWWALNLYGHHQVAVLDGGWNKWVADKRKTTAVIPSVAPGKFAAHIEEAWRRTGQQVMQGLDNKTDSKTKLVDARSPEEFAGVYSRAKRNGHIPGAVNLPREWLIAPDGTMLGPDALRQKFQQAGVDGSAPEVVTYCNAGISASFSMLALKVAGLPNAAVYDGSWKDWGNDETRPIETK